MKISVKGVELTPQEVRELLSQLRTPFLAAVGRGMQSDEATDDMAWREFRAMLDPPPPPPPKPKPRYTWNPG